MSAIDRVTPGFTILVGKPASGKSYLLSYLLALDHPHYNDNPILYAVVFTTTKFNRQWSEIFPEDYVHAGYNPGALQAMLDIQSENSRNRAAVIFDDCLDQKGFASQLFLNLTTTYRHYNLDVYISTQYLYRVPTTVRECATRVALFRTTTERSLKACYESFGAFFKTFDEFRKFLIEHTSDHAFIWYIANSSEEDRDKIYLPMKAPDKLPTIKFEY